MTNNPRYYTAQLIARLEAQGFTRPDLIRMTGLSKNTIWRMAVGEAREPKYETVQRLEKLCIKVARWS